MEHILYTSLTQQPAVRVKGNRTASVKGVKQSIMIGPALRKSLTLKVSLERKLWAWPIFHTRVN